MDRVIGSRNQKAVPKSKKTLNQFKYEVDDTGINIERDWHLNEMTWKKCGYLGDYMVKKLIVLSREQLIGRK